MSLEALSAVTWWMIAPLVIVGSLLHFAYDWSGHNRFVAVFGAVNESYWEHVKIAVWPIVVLQIVLFALGGYRYPSFLPAATISLYSIPVGMIGIVFVYKGIAKRNVLWIDIAAFAVIVCLSQVIFIGILEQLRPDTITVVIAAIYLAGLLTAFLRFTLRPPAEPDVFIDPLTRKYGLAGHGTPPKSGDA